MNKLMNQLHNPDLGVLFIRLALGAVFINAGWSKLNNMEGVVAFFASLGISSFFAYLVAYAEFIGGIAFVLGVAVRYFGVITAVIMVSAIGYVHWQNGFSLANGGYEQALVLLLLALAVITLGAGSYSLTRVFRR